MPKVGDKVLVHKLKYNEVDVIAEVSNCGKLRLKKNRDTLFSIRNEKGYPVRQATGVIYIEKMR